MADLVIKGEMDYISFYNISTGLKTLNPDNEYEVEELYEVVKNLLESGELESLITPIEVKLGFLDNMEILIDENEVDKESIILKNKNLVNIFNLEDAKESEVFLIRHYKGEGNFIYDIDNVDVSDLSFDYVDCSEEFDQYDILKDSYLESFCDMVVLDSIKKGEEELEFEDFIFDPQLVKDELYIVKVDPVSETKFLQKLDIGGDRLFGTDLDLEDYEEK